MTQARESDFVFNVVVTPGTFRYLGLFTRSLLAQSAVRVCLVANGCPPDELRSLSEFAADHDPRVEVVTVSTDAMLPHGVALDEVFAARDDGDYFCFMDSDVKARGPFMAIFLELLPQFEAVTSCNVAWSDDVILPAGSRELVGRHAVGDDGFMYGSSYLAIYSRPAVQRTREQWGVTFRAYAHEKLPLPVQARLSEMGREFTLYDTAKVLNILFQGDGFRLRHVDNPALVHVGGISQYLSGVPWFAAAGAGRERWDFAGWAAATLRSLVDGGPPPDLPADPQQAERAVVVRDELIELRALRDRDSVPPRADS